MSINTTLTLWIGQYPLAEQCSLQNITSSWVLKGNVWYQMELFSLVITTRMIIDVRWCLNIATRNCFYEHIVQANYLLCSLFLLDTNSESRAGIVSNNWISFVGQNQKRRLCLPLPHNISAAQQQGQLCLFVSLKRPWVGTKVHKWGTWDTGKSEPALPGCAMCFPLHDCLITKAHSAALNSALNAQNMHIGKGGGQSHPLQGIRHFFPLFGHTEALFFPSGQQHFSAQSSGLFWRPEQSCSAQTICWAWNSTQGQLAFSWGLKSSLKHLHLEFLQFFWQAKVKSWYEILKLNIKDHPEVSPTSAVWNTAEELGFQCWLFPMLLFGSSVQYLCNLYMYYIWGLDFVCSTRNNLHANYYSGLWHSHEMFTP